MIMGNIFANYVGAETCSFLFFYDNDKANAVTEDATVCLKNVIENLKDSFR